MDIALRTAREYFVGPWKGVCRENVGEYVQSDGRENIFTTSYHPQCDGVFERLKRTLCKDLAAFVSCEADWDLHLTMAVFRYNTSVHEATGTTPFKAIFGVDAFDFDSEIGWKMFLDDQNEVKSLPDA
jgi:hypothetical protein